MSRFVARPRFGGTTYDEQTDETTHSNQYLPYVPEVHVCQIGPRQQGTVEISSAEIRSFDMNAAQIHTIERMAGPYQDGDRVRCCSVGLWEFLGKVDELKQLLLEQGFLLHALY